MHNGCILCGGVGSGKSLTSLYYFRESVYPKVTKLCIITTARKRDSLEWDQEILRALSDLKLETTIDSWNNIHKHIKMTDTFFIFDEQRVVGAGEWVKSFLKITKNNPWILLSATPGDCWMDYVPVFLANGFYKNRTEFNTRHVVYSRFTKYPKVDRYVEVNRLIALRDKVVVKMDFERPTIRNYISYKVEYDKSALEYVRTQRKDPETKKPLRDAGDVCRVARKVVNSDASRIEAIRSILRSHDRLIIFYNFDYELEILRSLREDETLTVREWNGHNHDTLPTNERWVYLVQYSAGAEGWNCITTDTVVFYSLNYSYKLMEQAMGRIDRLNTPYYHLYYYTLKTESFIDKAIDRCIKNKKIFQESTIFDCMNA